MRRRMNHMFPLLPMLLMIGVCAAPGCKGTADVDPTAGEGLLDPEPVEVPRSPAAGVRLTVAESGDGLEYLTDAAARPLYVRAHDAPPCDSRCEARWPGVGGTRPPAEAAHPAVQEALIGTILRDDGTLQATYAGRRLYYRNVPLDGDRTPTPVADEWGDWTLIRPDGTPVAANDPAQP